MKKILVVDCNAKLGGIQKALISFLREESRENEVSVLFLYPAGSLLSSVPENVRVYATGSDMKYMGMSQADCVGRRDRIKRGFYAAVSRFAGQEAAVRIALRTVRDRIPGLFDEVISFSHMSDDRSFYGGTPQYALQFPNAKKRVCYIHCDYLNSGNRSAYSDRVYGQFDEIVCVSESTRKRFVQALPQLEDRTVARPNYIREDEIRKLAQEDPFRYDKAYINALTVARMTREKGIDRVIPAFGSPELRRPARLYIVGDGKEREQIEQLIRDNGCSGSVFLLGEQENPYRYMLNADFLLAPSRHEAAPVIFQEAKALGLPVLTSRTTSADEMIGSEYGMVAENDDGALTEAVIGVINHPEKLIRRFAEK